MANDMLDSLSVEDKSVTYISAAPENLLKYVQRAWHMRRFVITLAKREIKVRHANTYFGLLWVLLQPLPSIIVFTFFFDRIIQVDTGDVPYSIFALIGLIGWNYFTYLSVSLGNVLYESSDLIKKIYFPRILLLLSRVLSGALEFSISLVLLISAMLIFGTYPDSSFFYFPFFIVLNILFGLSIGVWLCILTYKRKDLMHVIPIIINFSIWLTPVFFPTTVLPSHLADVMYINPMTLICEGYRFALVGGPAPDLTHFGSVPVMVVLLLLGLNQFRKIDSRIAEHL
ncbi:MAG: ABC transporter permease [Flavobacteriales bacterium]|nr:ABC transporter permease [Flavobacteriales bacterium]